MEWNIVQLDCYPEKDGETDVVFTAHWTLSDSEIIGEETYTGSVYGSVAISLDDGSSFTPYNKLTKSKVVGLVKAAMGEETVAAHEAAVLQQIEDQKNPKVVSPALPWETLIAPLEAEA